LTASLKTRKH